MTVEKLDELIADPDFEKVVKAISVKPKPVETKQKLDASPLEEYNVADHPVFDIAKRKDKELADNELRKVNRIGLAVEKLIVSRAAAFLCANPIRYQASPVSDAEKKMWAAFKRVNAANKLDYKNQSILETRMSETEVAEIWYFDDADPEDDYWVGTDLAGKSKKEVRVFIVSKSTKDEIYPVWDDRGRLIAFGRGWKSLDEDGKDIEHFDLFTSKGVYVGTKGPDGWVKELKSDGINKTSVIYHSQPQREWFDVITIIRRLEDLYSNFADSNDRTAFPMLLLIGEVKDLPQGVADKALQMSGAGADARYAVPPNAPEAIKLEVDNLWRELHRLSDTVDITSLALQGIGQTSGVALELLFMPAHLKASKHGGTYGEGLQRRINLIKKMIIVQEPNLKEGMSLDITPTFDYFLPKDISELIDYLVSAVSGERPLLSQETAINFLQQALGGDAVKEYQKILAQANAPSELDKEQNREE